MEEQNKPQTKAEHLERMLEYVSPSELRKSVQRTLFAWLLEMDSRGIDANFKETVENHFFLMNFLDEIDSGTSDNSAN
jgi:hypothetical protein